MSKLVQKSTTQLDGNFLVMDVYQYDDGECRVEVAYRDDPSPNTRGTTVMVQRRASMELAVAAIARDFTTFATRALASLPTIGELVDSYDDEDNDDEDAKEHETPKP